MQSDHSRVGDVEHSGKNVASTSGAPTWREGRAPPTLLLLSMQNLNSWSARAETVRMPGGALPYGLQRLQHDFAMTWTDAQRSGIWATKPARAVGGAARRMTPGLQGVVGAACVSGKAKIADVALSVFENAGLGFARWQSLRRNLLYPPHIMIVCWLAEECQRMSRPQLRSIRRSLASVSQFVVFSRNQVEILHEFLGVEDGRVAVIPFGVDTDYYNPCYLSGPGGGGGVLAVGGDSQRDYSTLIEAIELLRTRLTLVCYPRNLTGISIPSNVRVLSGISHDRYRELLHQADIVVTPTMAPAYPSGQSVVLEAMSMGKPTITTDSSALRDYISDGHDGLLVAPRNARAMADQIERLNHSSTLRQELGLAAARTVADRFTLDTLWERVSGLLRETLIASRPTRPRFRRSGM